MGPCALTAASLAGALVLAPGTQAKTLTWGSSLAATPTLDTANGASHASGGHTTKHAVNPDPHDASDFTLWNMRIPGRSATAPRGGQVRSIRIKGCALEDHSAPSQISAGTPVNQINFQSLAPRGNGAYSATATAAGFRLPFCSDSTSPTRGAVNTSMITTFHPIHLCIARGGLVNFYDIGGYVPASSGFGFYPQGVPFEIIAPAPGSGMVSFADANSSGGTYAPGARPKGANSGYGTESGEQLMLQVVEGTGGDAYGLCPGGTANEPSNSNRVICAYHAPFDRHRKC
jgi:hypothetical protein